MSFEIAAKIRLARVVQRSSDLFVREPFRQQRKGALHSFAHEPGLGGRLKLFAKAALQGAHAQSEVPGQDLHSKSSTLEDRSEFVGLEQSRAHSDPYGRG